AQSILTNFSRELRRRFGLSRRKALQLTDVAQRVLTLDAANAIVLHYTARVRAAKNRGNELSGAIKDFDEAVKSVRSFVSDAVQSFSDNAARLSRLAGSASEESSVATEAARNTATNVSTIAAAVEQLSSSLGNISAQAVDGARVVEKAVARAVQTNEIIAFRRRGKGGLCRWPALPDRGANEPPGAECNDRSGASRRGR